MNPKLSTATLFGDYYNAAGKALDEVNDHLSPTVAASSITEVDPAVDFSYGSTMPFLGDGLL